MQSCSFQWAKNRNFSSSYGTMHDWSVFCITTPSDDSKSSNCNSLQSIEKLWSCLHMMTTTTTLSIAQKIGNRCRYSSWTNDDWSVFCIATPSDESKFQLQYSSIHTENEKLPSYDEDTNYPFNHILFCDISYKENCPEKIGSRCHYSSRTNAQISVHSITSAILWIFCLHTPWSKIQSFPIHEINARLSSTKC